jgi:ATP-dependent DNA helicase PIF1
VVCDICRGSFQANRLSSQRSLESLRVALGSPLNSSSSSAAALQVGTPIASSPPLEPSPLHPAVHLGTPVAPSSPFAPNSSRKRTATLTAIAPRPGPARPPARARAPWKHDDPELQRARNRRNRASRDHRQQRRDGFQPSATPSTVGFLSSAESSPISAPPPSLPLESSTAARELPRSSQTSQDQASVTPRAPRLARRTVPAAASEKRFSDDDIDFDDLVISPAPRLLGNRTVYRRASRRPHPTSLQARVDDDDSSSSAEQSPSEQAARRPRRSAAARVPPQPQTLPLRPLSRPPKPLSDYMKAEMPKFDGNLDDSALPDAERVLLRNFRARVERQTVMETCDRCERRWFDLGLRLGVCADCRNSDKEKLRPGLNDPFLYSARNNMHFGDVPAHLPELTQVEEQLIARVHVYLDVRIIRGQQYRYSKHCVSFLRNTSQLFDQLPRLPKDLELVALRPKSIATDAHAIRLFGKQMRINRLHIQQWLEYLVVNHPGYSGLTINHERLSQLPDNASQYVTVYEIDDLDPEVINEVTRDQGPAGAGPDQFDDNNLPDLEHVSAAPNTLSAELGDISRLRAQLGGSDETFSLFPPLERVVEQGAEPRRLATDPTSSSGPRDYFNIPDARSTPINDFGMQQTLLSLAMPTLFPQGLAEFSDPRPRAVTFKQWVRHALLWKDGRFARHPRFPYFVFNTIVRNEVNKKANFFVKGQEAIKRQFETAAELQVALDTSNPASKALVNSIVRAGQKLPGTRPFWEQHRNQLIALCHKEKCPHVFITASPADYHWESLAWCMPRYEQWLAADDDGKYAIAQQNLRENPHIAAFHFFLRWRAFFEEYLKPRLGIKYWWYRFEWQGRGSTHVHGLYWLHGAYSAPLQGFLNDQEKQQFVQFWGVHCTAFNPQPRSQEEVAQDRRKEKDRRNEQRRRRRQGLESRIEQITTNALLLRPGETATTTFRHLTRLINRVQRHECNDYCLRRYKLPNDEWSEDRVCRFYYPRTEHEAAVVTKALNASKSSPWDTYDGIRNDPRVNNYMPGVLLGWGANVDCTPCTSLDAVVHYIAKYVAKHEVKTKPYDELANELVTQVKDSRPLVSLAAKMVNKLFTERDWPAMEVAHHLLGYDLVETSHDFLSVNMYLPTGSRAQVFVADSSTVKTTKSVWEKYCARDDDLAEVTYFQFLSMFDHRTLKPFTARAKPRALNYFPSYSSDQKDAAAFEEFARVKLMLQHPHRCLSDLKHADGVDFETFAEAYLYCRRAHAHADDDYYGKDLPKSPDDDLEDVEPDPEEGELEAWGAIAGARGGEPTDNQDVPILGNRAVDLAYDWQPHVGRYAEVAQRRDFWKQMKAEHPIGETDPVARSQSALAQLNEQQPLVYDTVVRHWEAALDRSCAIGYEPRRNQLLLQVEGRGGTGKSFTLKIVVDELRSLALRAGLDDSGLLQIVAPTGVAANAINGRTIHSLLRLPVGPQKDMPDLSIEAATSLRHKLVNVEYLVIDEKSMISPSTLYRIDRRLRQILERPDVFFGGCSVLLMGDFCQLPPVKAAPLFKPVAKLKKGEETGGHAAYLAFDQTITLTQLVRQSDPDQEAFRHALEELRNNTVSPQTWELLASRCRSKLSEAEVSRFDNAVRIYPTNERVIAYNKYHLERLDAAIVMVNAVHSGTGAETVTSRDAGNLHSTLPLCVGARIMLTENRWTEAGLVNGAFGRIYDIAWSPDVVDPLEEPPCLLLVRMEKYSGPRCFDDEDIPDDVVPIFTSLRDFTKSNHACTRHQFPVTIAYAITIHKSQGATLSLVVLNVKTAVKTAGLVYVAISRATRLDGIMFDENFELKDLRIEKDLVGGWRLDDLRRRQDAGQMLNIE